MRHLLRVGLWIPLLAGVARAEMPAEVLARLKAATVLVNASGRYAESSGSGFVLIVKDKTVYIVTNAHTTELGGKPAQVVSAVFSSRVSSQRTSPLATLS